MSTINLHEKLKGTILKYQKDFLAVPILSAQDTLQHMTGMPNCRGKVALPSLRANAEVVPYRSDYKGEGTVDIDMRELEAYLGACVEQFDPNAYYDTIYGSFITQGKALQETELMKSILTLMAGQIGKNIGLSVWKAKRNPSGKKTTDLFDGFDTITDTEISGSKITTGLGNLHEFSAAINKTNAVDLLKEFYFSASDELQAKPTKLFISKNIYNAYNEDYKTTTGATPYNREYKKTFLEGSDDLCELVPMVSKKDSKYIHLSTKNNMKYGYGNKLANDNLTIEKYDPFIVSFIATMFFGVQFNHIHSDFLLVGKLHA